MPQASHDRVSAAAIAQVGHAARPTGAVDESHFSIVESDIPHAGEGEFVVRAHYLSLDPYMRGRMSEAKSYATAQALDETMIGGTAGEVLASKHARFAAGDHVVGMLGWAEMGVCDGALLRKVERPVR